MRRRRINLAAELDRIEAAAAASSSPEVRKFHAIVALRRLADHPTTPEPERRAALEAIDKMTGGKR
jgi:hypothetical protein